MSGGSLPAGGAIRRDPPTIGLGQDRPDQPAETLGLLVMQVAGQARAGKGVRPVLERSRATPQDGRRKAVADTSPIS
jgi:hypothetical protein